MKINPIYTTHRYTNQTQISSLHIHITNASKIQLNFEYRNKEQLDFVVGLLFRFRNLFKFCSQHAIWALIRLMEQVHITKKYPAKLSNFQTYLLRLGS